LDHLRISEGRTTSLLAGHNRKASTTFFPGTLCFYLPVNELCSEIYLRASSFQDVNALQYTVVDCRPEETFQYGRIPTSISFPADLPQNNPDAFIKALEHLSPLVKKNHFVLIADTEDDIFRVLSFFIQRNFAYLSVLEGGYRAFHENALKHHLEIENHNAAKCEICTPVNPLGASVKNFWSSSKVFSGQLLRHSAAGWNEFIDALHDLDKPASNVIHRKSNKLKPNLIQ
jgi:hypothetical protein